MPISTSNTSSHNSTVLPLRPNSLNEVSHNPNHFVDSITSVNSSPIAITQKDNKVDSQDALLQEKLEFEKILSDWVNSPIQKHGEQRKDVAQKVKEAYEQNASTLDLSLIRCSTIPDLSKLTALKEINIFSVCKLDKCPESDKLPKSLEKFVICGITEIPNFSSLTSLKDLAIIGTDDRGGLDKFPEINKLPKGLERLTLSRNPIIEIPDLSSLTNLKELNVSFCKLQNLPDSLPDQLTKLNARINPIKNLYLSDKIVQGVLTKRYEIILDHSLFSYPMQELSLDTLYQSALTVAETLPNTQIHFEKLEGRQQSYKKNVDRWEGRPVSEYDEYRKTSKRAWLNEVPSKIDMDNLAMHGTNLDAVIRAIKMGGQILPKGNVAKRGGQQITGEGGAISDLNMRRVSTVALSHSSISEALSSTRQYADSASSTFLENKTISGACSYVPIVVIGDGMDHIIGERHSSGDHLAGVDVMSDIGGEVAFKRLNIRGLLCPESVKKTLEKILKEIGRPDLTVTTFEDAEKSDDALKLMRIDIT